ncbi:cathelicidin-related peptide Pt_CRAMP2-like [Ornithorhynchus anatinus]|uniref:cathelicidin-related peptide Pt_CRAMP2-like n=1 Tax=Ornithorhynchus anatinus TaxID=9258 RepID=UPI0004544026|nr:cathelicidin-related peptide Pt_CRAMP2-like [Ornithorhynchus anatinus]
MASGAWRVLLLVSVAAALTPARGLSHREAVNLALDTYNRGSDVDRAFRVFGSVPRPRPAPSPTTIPLNFTVKETVCFKREKFDLDQCDFRDRGLVRDCTGFVSTAQRPPTVTISCEGPIRTKRFLFSLIRATFSIGRAVSATVRGLRYRFRRNKRRRG